MWQQQKFNILDHSHVGEARRFCQILSEDLGFDETLKGKVSIVATELSTNMVKHAGGGELIVTRSDRCLHLLALDKGKGMTNIHECFLDGYSSEGTSGNGLSAIKRGAQAFDIFTSVGKGTAVYVGFHEENLPPHKLVIGAVAVPYKEEPVCGDSWSGNLETQRFMVADGLGHGLLAHEASSLAQQIFREEYESSLEQLMQNLHGGLRVSRGAAVSVADIDLKKGIVNYCGIGNVAGTIINPDSVKRCISHNGTVGVQLRKVQSLPYPMDIKDGIFIMASDGLSTQWNLTDYPGLASKHPYLIAGVLYRDYGKKTDDVTVLVVKADS